MQKAIDGQCSLWEGRAAPPDPTYELLAQILVNAPKLPRDERALCRVNPMLHASSDPELIEAARDVCSVCPALSRCREYVDGMPQRQWRNLSGTWAGRYFGDPDGIPRHPI